MKSVKNARLTPALLALDALLVIVLAALWLAPGPVARWRQWQPPAPQPPNLDDMRAARLTPNPALRRDYPAIVERPLFAADRKPRASASDPKAAAPPPDSLDQVKLYGLIDGPAAQGALLDQGGQPQFVRIGEKVGDWTLQAIEGRNAIFARGGERRAVPLPDSLSNGESATAPAISMPAPTPAMPRSVPSSPAAPPQPMPTPQPQPTFQFQQMPQPMQMPQAGPMSPPIPMAPPPVSAYPGMPSQDFTVPGFQGGYDVYAQPH